MRQSAGTDSHILITSRSYHMGILTKLSCRNYSAQLLSLAFFLTLLTCSVSADSIQAQQMIAPTPTPTPTPAASPTPEDKAPDPTPDPAAKPDRSDDAADSSQIDDSDSDDSQQDPPPKEKRGAWVFAPIPIISPAFGNGVILGGGYIFKLNMDDDISPPSSVGAAAVFTSNGSRGFGVGAALKFGENKYDLTAAFAKGKGFYRYYPIGSQPGGEDLSVLIKQTGTIFFGQFMRNVWKDVFVGPRFQYRDLTAAIEGFQTPGGFEVPEIELRSKSTALGFKVKRDKRDSSFYPTAGSYWDVTGDFFFRKKFLGIIDRNYQVYRASYNGYRSIGEKQVLAYRGMACTVSDGTPFYDLCLFGGSDLRGYTTGQFQNRRMFATQVEYRRELPWRFGVVGFAGVGGVARRWGDLRFSELLPAVGAGVRFKIEKTNHINYRADVGYGRAGVTLTISVMEAF